MSKEHTPLVQCFELYLDECKYVKNLRPATLKAYSETFYQFIKLVPEAYCPAQLTPLCFTSFSKQLKHRKGKEAVKDSSLRTYYNNLLAFIRFLERNDYLPKGKITNNLSKPPIPQYHDDRALTEEEVSTIVSSIALHTIDDEFLYIRDMTIVNLLLYTGIRKGELLGLRIHDIDFMGKTLFINKDTSKSKKSRYIPLNPILENQLKQYLQALKNLNIHTEKLLISQRNYAPLSEHGLKHWVERYRKKSGVAFHLHRFRHTFACTLAKNNANMLAIRNLLGHTNLTMTERYLRSIQSESSRSFINDLSY